MRCPACLPLPACLPSAVRRLASPGRPPPLQAARRLRAREAAGPAARPPTICPCLSSAEPGSGSPPVGGSIDLQEECVFGSSYSSIDEEQGFWGSYAAPAGAAAAAAGQPGRSSLRAESVLLPPDPLLLRKGLPAKHIGSDHLMLMTNFKLSGCTGNAGE